LEVVTPSWQPHMHDRDTGTIDRGDYACCVPGQLRARLRRRDMTPPHSTGWGDPRAELLTWQTSTGQRDTFCEDLVLEPEPASVVGQLSAALDTGWRTAARDAANHDLRAEHRHGRGEIVLTPLDAGPEPASLVTLRARVEAMLGAGNTGAHLGGPGYKRDKATPGRRKPSGGLPPVPALAGDCWRVWVSTGIRQPRSPCPAYRGCSSAPPQARTRWCLIMRCLSMPVPSPDISNNTRGPAPGHLNRSCGHSGLWSRCRRG